ncbi:MAG: ABC transporter substrate-binding protein [Gemmatimonadales bacterium]|nr:ABC transporter substrate-binding protein [Gemmatimonadales bacterium]
MTQVSGKLVNLRPAQPSRLAWATLALGLALGCRPAARTTAAELARLPWDSVLARAKGTTVVWRMWRGDPSINAFVDQWVAPRVKERHGITLSAVEGQGPEIVNQLVVEREARAPGSADLVWINGETFGNLRQEGLLDGPWAGSLPNARFVDSVSPIIRRDFEQDPAGYESPWGQVQFTLIYDSARTPDPPRTVAALASWILTHPGRFTHDQQFTGTTFLMTVFYALGGGVRNYQGGFDSLRYATGSAQVFHWLERHRAAFWRGGETYPPGVAELHRLFANREVDFSMSYNQNEALTKARQGVLPATARPLLLQDGTIANTHFVGIPFNAAHIAGAMVLANFLLSPEAQLEKQKPEVWADGTVLARNRLPPEWAARFARLSLDPRALASDSLAKYARPEVSPRYRERLSADWRARVRRVGQ